MILRSLSQNDSTVSVGTVYRRCGAGSLVETARVLEVAPDRMGIPHVRFQLQVRRGTGMPTMESRTLALEIFQSRFRERVKA